MIDYIKAYLKDKSLMESNLKNSRVKEFKGKMDMETKKLEYPLRAKYENLFINITEKGGHIENSIHKYFNEVAKNPPGNYSDFYYCDLVSALKTMESELKYDLEKTILTRFEFGFNLHIGFNPTQILENNVLGYDLKSPCYNPKNDKNMKIKEFIYDQYVIKIYNKSLHYQLNDDDNFDILRVEIKYKSKKVFNKFGIYNLNDLKNPTCLKLIFNDFMKKLEKLDIIDSYKGSDEMSIKKRNQFIKFTNENYWIDLKNNFHKNTVLNKKNEFKKMIEDYHLDTWKIEIMKLLHQKFNQLMDTNCNTNVESQKLVA